MTSNTRLLSELKPGDRRVILKISGHDRTIERLVRMGFVEGASVEVAHEAPFGKDPIAVRIRGALIALRREEAVSVEVSGE